MKYSKLIKAFLRVFSISILFIVGCSKSDDGTPPNTNLESVTIGTQIWANKNLEVTNYSNGDPIPQVQDASAWAATSTGAWCYYDNNVSNGTTYGKLYNWYAVNDPRGLAPAGWIIPAAVDWEQLSNFLGGDAVSGGKLKTTTLWDAPNSGATNSSGFSGLPGGYRNEAGNFNALGDLGLWWTTTEQDDGGAWSNSAGSNYASLDRDYDRKGRAFSVRCVKD